MIYKADDHIVETKVIQRMALTQMNIEIFYTNQ